MLEVALGELPELVWGVESILEALGLLFLGDVQVELDDGGSLVGEQALELVNMAVASPQLGVIALMLLWIAKSISGCRSKLG